MDFIKIINSDFEVGEPENVPGWTPMHEGVISIDTTRSHGGKSSLKLTSTLPDNPWAMQEVVGLKTGAIYQLASWVCVDCPEKPRAELKVEQFTESGAYIPEGAFTSRMHENTNAQFTYRTLDFVVHPDTYTTRIYLRIDALGTAWYDDVTLKLSGGPDPYDFYCDHVFHYPDEKGGRASVKLNVFYAKDGKEATEVDCDFEICDGEKVTASTKGVKIVDGVATFDYPLSALPELHKQYVMRCRIKRGGEVVNEWERNLYVYERPTMLDEKGNITIDGKPFYPVTAYHTGIDSLKYLPEAGINTATIGFVHAIVDREEQREAFLAELDRLGMKGLFGLYLDMHPAGSAYNEERTKWIVNKYKDDKRILAWMIMDEPFGSKITDERRIEIENSYRIIRDIDSYHPVYVLDYSNHEETIKYGDIYVADVYCHLKSATAVSEVIGKLNTPDARIHAWELAATYKQSRLFPPTRTIRSSLYRAFAAGSRGIGYYSIDDAIGHDQGDVKTPLYKLDVWKDLCTLGTELNTLHELHYAPKSTKTSESKDGAKCVEKLIQTYEMDGSLYILAHNRSEKDGEKMTIATGVKSIGKIESLGLTAAVPTVTDGNFTIKLDSEEAALYKIEIIEK